MDAYEPERLGKLRIAKGPFGWSISACGAVFARALSQHRNDPTLLGEGVLSIWLMLFGAKRSVSPSHSR